MEPPTPEHLKTIPTDSLDSFYATWKAALTLTSIGITNTTTTTRKCATNHNPKSPPATTMLPVSTTLPTTMCAATTVTVTSNSSNSSGSSSSDENDTTTNPKATRMQQKLTTTGNNISKEIMKRIVLTSGALVVETIQTNDVGIYNRTLVCNAIQDFTKHVMLPSMLKSKQHFKKDKIFMGSLLILWQVLIQNSNQIFCPTTMMNDDDDEDRMEEDQVVVEDNHNTNIEDISTGIIFDAIDLSTNNQTLAKHLKDTFAKVSSSYSLSNGKKFVLRLEPVSTTNTDPQQQPQKISTSTTTTPPNEKVQWKIRPATTKTISPSPFFSTINNNNHKKGVCNTTTTTTTTQTIMSPSSSNRDNHHVVKQLPNIVKT